MIVAIPSKGRAGQVTSHWHLGNMLSSTYLFVPEREADAYAAHYAQMMQIVPVPDVIRGITATRNFILDWAQERNEQYIVQVDDDCIVFGYLEGMGAKAKMRHVVPADRVASLFANMFLMADELGTNLWGFSVSQDPQFYRVYSPFSLTSVIVGNLMGIIVDGQRFDERLTLKEDYDFALQSLHRHRRVLRFNKYHWFVNHQTKDGGCKDYRSYQAELDAIAILRQKWGAKIIQAHPRKPYEITVQVPIKGI